MNLGRKMHKIILLCTYLFLYLPIIVLLIFSFNSESFPSPWKEFTWKWYVELFEATYLWKAFTNSLVVALSSTLTTLFLSVSLIFYVFQGGRIKKFLVLYYANVLIPETMLAVALLGFFTLTSIPLGLITLIVAHIVLGLGFVIPVLYACYQRIDKKLIEASLALGATPIQTFFKIIFPLIRPSLVATGLLIFIISFDDFIIPYFCAGSSVQTLTLYIMTMLKTGVSPVVNALAALLLGFSSLLALLFFSFRTRARIF